MNSIEGNVIVRRSSEAIKRNVGLLFVLLITLLVYFPSLFYHFVSDDYIALIKIATSTSLSQVFQLKWAYYFRPINWLPFLLGYTLAGLPIPPDPSWQTGSFLAAYHLLNLVFHLANVLLVYLIASFIFKSRIYRMLTAFIFAIHPVNSEVVCWVSAIGDYAFVFFCLLSTIFFAKFYLNNRKIPSLLFYLGSLLSFILALCSKEAALCLPFLIILISYFLEKTENVSVKRKKRLSWFGYFLVVGFYFVIRQFIWPLGGLFLLDLFRGIPDKIFRIAYYLRDLIFPLELTILKQFLYHYSLVPIFIVVTIFLSGLFVYILVFKFRRFPVLIFSLGFLAITFVLPLLGNFAPARRHLYFPLAGYSIFLVSLISLVKKKCIGIFLLSLIIILQIWTSLGRNHLFQFAGQVVQKSLFELKKDLPKLEPESIIYAVGIPGVAKNTPAFWAGVDGKIRFIYRDKNLPVFCLSVIAFTENSIQDTELSFLDNFTFVQVMQTNLEEFIRVPEENFREHQGDWSIGLHSNTKFKILKRDRFGNIEQVMFRLNPQVLKGKKVYLLGFKEGRIQVLRKMDYK